MTELYELFKNDRKAAEERIQNMDTALLFAELDDTLQFDALHMDNVEWAKMPGMRVYRMLLREIHNRCRD